MRLVFFRIWAAPIGRTTGVFFNSVGRTGRKEGIFSIFLLK